MTSYASNGTSTPVRRVGAPPVKKEIWSSLLKSVSSGKRLAAKQLVILGGTAESQRDFITSLDTDPGPATSTRHLAKPPIANDFALGYTYQDVLDTDHEDILARLAIYTLAKPSPKFLPLLRPLFTAQTIPDMLLVILLDWSDPWNWIRQLLSWIRLLHALLRSLPAETVQALQDNIVEWRDRKRNDAKDPGVDAGGGADPDAALPLGPGEWDAPLGVPLCVVCQNANAIETLERESGWKDRHFDFVQQYLRTVLLKHGGSLIYTMPHLAGGGGALQTLVHSSLGIESMLKKKTLKYNTTDRDHILVPPNFDSWGKIRILTDDFNVEEVSEAWTLDIKDVDDAVDEAQPAHWPTDPDLQHPRAPNDAVSMYEEVIKHPRREQAMLGLLPERPAAGGLEVQCKDAQLFLAEQAEILEGLGKEDERVQRLQEGRKNVGNPAAGDIEEHIGPVQFNMGGIQIDAEDQLKKLKDREASRASEVDTPKTPPPPVEGEDMSSEKLNSFFVNLVKQRGSSANSPRGRRTDTPGR